MITERVKDIISRIVRTMGGLEDLKEIEKKLFSTFDHEGYEYAEVREAFDIILHLLDASRTQGLNERRPLRILCPDESVRLTRRARAWLMSRYHTKEIGLDDLETVLNSVVMQNCVFDEQDVRALMKAVLAPSPGDPNPPGRITVH